MIHIKIMTINYLFSRWKGENISTTEVDDVLGLIDCVQEVIVYGVSVSGMSEILDISTKEFLNTLTKYKYTELQGIGGLTSTYFS